MSDEQITAVARAIYEADLLGSQPSWEWQVARGGRFVEVYESLARAAISAMHED